MSNFLENKNIDFLFDTVSKKVLSITNYDMVNNIKYKGVFTQLLETIAETINKNKNKNIGYLNNLAVEKTTPFMTDIIKKEQSVCFHLMNLL